MIHLFLQLKDIVQCFSTGFISKFDAVVKLHQCEKSPVKWQNYIKPHYLHPATLPPYHLPPSLFADRLFMLCSTLQRRPKRSDSCWPLMLRFHSQRCRDERKGGEGWESTYVPPHAINYRFSFTEKLEEEEMKEKYDVLHLYSLQDVWYISCLSHPSLNCLIFISGRFVSCFLAI